MLNQLQEMHVIISGNVQGIGFRATAKKYADRLKIKGTARNLPDGSVEICAQGFKKDLDQFLEFLKEAFSENYIHNIDVNFSPSKREYEGFKIIF